MKPANFFSLFILPFYSPGVYVDSAKNRKGYMLLPFLFFFLVCSIPYIFNLVSSMSVWDKIITQQMQKMPEFKITAGQLSLPKGTKPYISYSKENKIAIAIDPAGDEEILKPYERGILFAGKKLYAKNGINTPSVDYPHKGESVINYPVLRNTMIFVYVLFIVFGIPILLSSFFLVHLFIVLTINFLSAFFPDSKLLARDEVFRIAVTASMPMTLVICLLRAAGLESLLLYFGAVIVSAFFMNFGIKQVSPD
jgi:hypothetical protein